MRCLSASAAILTVVAGVFFLIQGLPACPNGIAPQDLPLPPPPPPPPKALLLALGVITAPGHFNRRVWMRQKLRVTEARRRGVRVLFVLGSQNHMNGKQRKAVRHEERAHRDVIFVPARDYLPHAVAEKSLGWWLYAASNLQAKWIGKTDDDSLTYLPRLVCPCHSNLPMQPPRQVTEAQAQCTRSACAVGPRGRPPLPSCARSSHCSPSALTLHTNAALTPHAHERRRSTSYG